MKTLPLSLQRRRIRLCKHLSYTVGPMKRHLTLSVCVLSLLTSTSPALAVDALELKVSRIGDVELSCGELSQEAVLMRDIIMTTEDIKDNSDLKTHGITAAGALGSFLVGTATGGIGIAAAGFLLKNETNNKKEEADGVQDIAEQRRSLMMGIYNAKGCAGPIEHAMQDNISREEEALVQIAAVESGTSAGNEQERPERRQPRYNR